MLNANNERELAYVAEIGWVKPIEGADNIELVGVQGWTCVAKKGEFRSGDKCVYFEIDSKLPATDWSEFLAPKHYKVKTMKLSKFGVVSQGLALPFDAFGWEQDKYTVGEFLTQTLGVKYSIDEDNDRKANKKNPDAVVNAILARHPQIARRYGKFIKNHKVVRWLFIALFGHKNDKRSWIAGVPKTDEERIENRPSTLMDSSVKWIATEKIDGSSTTFYLSRGKLFKPAEYLVCSRNVVFDTPKKAENSYYQEFIGKNIYLEMSDKYNMRAVLKALLAQRPSAQWVAIQAETFGKDVQKRDYSMKNREIRAFNLLYSDCGRVGTLEMRDALTPFGVPVVPIISEGMVLPLVISELREFVHSAPSAVDGKIKEGIVFRTLDGKDSFKCVDPEFLLKYHQ